MSWAFLLCGVIALIVSAMSLSLLYNHATRLGLIDTPGGHKHHDQPTPVVGGIGIYLAVFTALVTAIVVLDIDRGTVMAFLAGAGILVTTGIIDDRVHLGPAIKGLAQFLAACCLMLGGGIMIHSLGNLFGLGEIVFNQAGAIAFTLFAVIGLTNATNMMDGADGLASSVALTIVAAAAVLAFLSGATELQLLCLVLAAAILPFLRMNLRHPGQPRARAFLGDAGSMLLGYSLAWLVIPMTQGPAAVIPPVAAILFLLLPVLDTLRLIHMRLKRGDSPFDPDNEHFHHLILRATRGTAVGVPVVAVAITALAIGIAALATLAGLPDVVLTVTVIACYLAYYRWAARIYVSQASMNRTRD